ncbi:hypothetical protein, partial [Paracraurococcus lichenis]
QRPCKLLTRNGFPEGGVQVGHDTLRELHRGGVPVIINRLGREETEGARLCAEVTEAALRGTSFFVGVRTDV